jgi:hypothetical protein
LLISKCFFIFIFRAKPAEEGVVPKATTEAKSEKKLSSLAASKQANQAANQMAGQTANQATNLAASTQPAGQVVSSFATKSEEPRGMYVRN